jgi:MFS family permease
MLAALFLSVMCTMGDMVVTPIVADLYTVFADAPEALINLGVTGPAIAGLPFCFLGGWLADHMDKKVLMVVNGKNKAEAVKAALTGPVDPKVPASILQLHPDFTLVADEEALSLL